MIEYISELNTFHIYNKYISYIFRINENKELIHVYFGKKTNLENIDFKCLDINFKYYTLDKEKREFPDFGRGDFNETAYIVNGENSNISHFKYDSYKICNSYIRIDNFPHLKAKNSSTLLIKLKDSLTDSYITLKYTLLEDYPALIRNASIKSKDILLKKFLSFSMDFDNKEYSKMITLGSGSYKEFNYEISKINQGISKIYSKNGISSAKFNPFLAITSKKFNFNYGKAVGFNLIYSGNFEANVELNSTDKIRVNMGINSEIFEVKLKDDEFISPEVLIVYSNKGLNKLSQIYHDIYRKYLLKEKKEYVLLNSWEGTYFNYDEKKIIEMINKASLMGINLFVIDDGWFGNRFDDDTSLGDWKVNTKKFPNGLSKVIEKCKEKNIDFGIWLEPEMISKKSDLYKKHPEFLLSSKNREDISFRNQYNLDFSNKKVIEYIYNSISKLLDEYDIKYIKWDMNKSLTMVDNEEKYINYTKNLYFLLEKLEKKYPHILFEMCSSGGNRFDPGMLYYGPQIWASDNTDALDRLNIQFGASIVYPLCSISSHITEVPNHATGRVFSMEYRRNVSLMGTFGYELDPKNLNYKEIKKDIDLYLKYRDIINRGDFYRLKHSEKEKSYMIYSKRKDKALLLGFSVEKFDIKNIIGHSKYKIEILSKNKIKSKILENGNIKLSKKVETILIYLEKEEIND